VVEDAQPDRVAPIERGRGDQAEAALLEAPDQRGVQPSRLPFLFDAREPAPEADDPELRGREQLELGVLADQPLGPEGEVEAAVDRGPERVDAEVAETATPSTPESSGSAGTRDRRS